MHLDGHGDIRSKKNALGFGSLRVVLERLQRVLGLLMLLSFTALFLLLCRSIPAQLSLPPGFAAASSAAAPIGGGDVGFFSGRLSFNFRPDVSDILHKCFEPLVLYQRLKSSK